MRRGSWYGLVITLMMVGELVRKLEEGGDRITGIKEGLGTMNSNTGCGFDRGFYILKGWDWAGYVGLGYLFGLDLLFGYVLGLFVHF